MNRYGISEELGKKYTFGALRTLEVYKHVSRNSRAYKSVWQKKDLLEYLAPHGEYFSTVKTVNDAIRDDYPLNQRICSTFIAKKDLQRSESIRDLYDEYEGAPNWRHSDICDVQYDLGRLKL